MVGVISIWGIIIILVIFLPLIIGSMVLGWQKKINVKHNESGILKNCFVGYSWTYFFFGFFVGSLVFTAQSLLMIHEIAESEEENVRAPRGIDAEAGDGGGRYVETMLA